MPSEPANLDSQYILSDDEPVVIPNTLGDARLAAEITSISLNDMFNYLGLSYSGIITQRNVARHMEAVMRAEGADGPLSFPTLVMSGSELVQPHGDPHDDSSHVIDPDSEPIVMIDVGCKYNEHCSDVTRTYFFDSATEEMFDAYQAVLDAEMAIIHAIEPGVKISTLHDIYLTHIENYVGVSGVDFLTIWGHGVGQYVHEQPYLGAVGDEALVEGQVFAIEPGLYFSDGWAVRVEDTVVVTQSGCEILSDAPRELSDVQLPDDGSYVDVMFQSEDYDYGYNANLNMSILDESNTTVDDVELFNGSQWITPSQVSYNEFKHSFYLDYSYNSIKTWISKLSYGSRPVYMTKILEASSLAFEEYNVSTEPTPSVNGPRVSWCFENHNASMLRIQLENLTGTGNQLLIVDGYGSVVADHTGLRKGIIWTPWVSGQVMYVELIFTEQGAFAGLNSDIFDVAKFSIVVEELVPQITTTTSTDFNTTLTDPISNTVSSPDQLSLDGLLVLIGVSSLGLCIVLIPSIWFLRRTR